MCDKREKNHFKLFMIVITTIKIITRIKDQQTKINHMNKLLINDVERLNKVESLSHLGNYEVNLQTGKTIWSDELFRIFGYEPKSFEPTSEKRIELTYPDDKEFLRNNIKKAIDEKSSFRIENRIVRPDGSIHWILSTGCVEFSEDKKIQSFIGTLIDITERKLLEKSLEEEKARQNELYYMSYYDSLTGLYNRNFFEKEMEKLDTENNLPIAIIMGNVNGLKLTNDAFGHSEGDKLLKKAALTIKTTCRKNDISARWGGDEFTILLPKTEKCEAESIVQRIKTICSNIQIDSIDVSISFGCDAKENINDDILKVLKNAEDYMYKNKVIESDSMRGNIINTILNTLHEKNPREERHSKRVSELCQQIGLAMELPKIEINKLKVVGLLHDIGKIAIEESILNKPGKLTDKEWDEIRRHPDIGYRILSSSNEMLEIADYVLAHHERFDGLGYPQKLKGEKIPLLSRIIAIADSYDAMTSERSYRKPLDKNTVVNELIKSKGTQFDPQIVNIFIKKVLNNHQTID